jgi:hypothetical protein
MTCGSENLFQLHKIAITNLTKHIVEFTIPLPLDTLIMMNTKFCFCRPQRSARLAINGYQLCTFSTNIARIIYIGLGRIIIF